MKTARNMQFEQMKRNGKLKKGLKERLKESFL